MSSYRKCCKVNQVVWVLVATNLFQRRISIGFNSQEE